MNATLLLFAIASTPQVDVVTDGKTYSGTISISNGTVAIDNGASTSQVTLDKVRAIHPRSRPTITKHRVGNIWVGLIGGSVFRGAPGTFALFQKQTLDLVHGEDKLSLPHKTVRYVRYSAPDRKLDEQWKEILASTRDGDTLVIRRPGNVLDRLEGVVTEIKQKTVSFEFDGDIIPVNRDRIDGLVFFHPPSESQIGHRVCSLETLDGNSWVLKEVSLEGTQWKGVTVSGVPVTTPFSNLSSVEFSRVDSIFLSDLDIDQFRWRPLVSLPGMDAQLQQLERPRRDRGFGSEKLELWIDDSGGRVRQFEKGLAMTSRSEVTYRIRGEYRQLVSLMGIDAGHRSHGHVQLTVLGDDKTLLDEPVSGDEFAREINVNLTGVKRLTIQVGFGEGLDVGDYLNLCDARLVK